MTIDPDRAQELADIGQELAEREAINHCRYCGPGPCRSTARTANGADLARFEKSHGP